MITFGILFYLKLSAKDGYNSYLTHDAIVSRRIACVEIGREGLNFLKCKIKIIGYLL